MIRYTQVSRRQFLGTTAALSATFAVPSVLRARDPNSKLNVAVIGIAGRGNAQLQAAANMENIVALCDVDDRNLGKLGERFPSAKKYADFRKMLSEMDKQIDAVMVSTPDHTHAPAAAMAMRLGKHCYCEKPLAHSVFETRTLNNIAREKKVVTQMGTQIHAGDNYRRVVEAIQAGVIGPVEEVHVWCGKNWAGGKRGEAQPVPDYLHWNLWLGPSPERPYNPCYLPANWRRHWDFGNGTLGDMACHIMDVVFWALRLRHPTSVAAEGPPVDLEGCAADLIVRYAFGARENLPAVNVTWYDGKQVPPILKEKKIPVGGIGALFVGKDGMLRTDYGRHQLFPVEKFKDYKAPEPTIQKSIGHHKEFFEAAKTGGPTTCNFDYSGALTESVLLGAVAYRVGKALEWDAEKLRATNCREADKYIRSEYRNGWKL